MRPALPGFNAGPAWVPCEFGTLAKKQARAAQESGAGRCRICRQSARYADARAVARIMHPLTIAPARARDGPIPGHGGGYVG